MKHPFSLRSEMGIRKRVFLLLAALFVPLILLQTFTFYSWYRGGKEAEMQANLELGRTVSKAFDAFINDVLHTQLALGLAATASPPPSDESLRRILQTAEESHPMLRSFTWSTPAGVSLVTTNTAVGNPRIRTQALVPKIVSGEEYGVSDLHDSPNTGEKVFVIGRGIRDPQGRLLGIMSCVCVPDKLDPLLAVRRSKNTAISLIDRQGSHVYRHPAVPDAPAGMNRLERQPVIRQALEGREAAVEAHGPRGEMRLAAFVPIRSIGWVAASSRAKQEVLASVSRTLLPHALLMLLVTLAAFGAAVVLSRPITESLQRLLDQAAAFGRGAAGRLETVHGPAEIKRLSEAFQTMAEKVHSRERALRESEEKFRSLVETTSDRIWETDGRGVYTFVSPRVRDLLGYGPEEYLGRKPFDFMPPEDSASVKTKIAGFARERKPFIGIENVSIGKDGRRVVLETSGVPRLDGRRNFLGYRGIDRDITDRKRAEEALQRSHDELELRVRERTAELERRNQELQNFTFAASHDLQEPLRKIQMFSDLIATRYAGSVSGKGREYIRRMNETAARMRDVLQSLMRYSRLTSPAEPFVRVDLNEIAKEVVTDLELQILDSGAVVEIGRLPEIEADPGRMRQLFQNLLGNGLKFRREGVQPQIRIHAGSGPQAGRCEIHFSDNGIGFKEEYLGTIFKPFHRLHGSEKYAGVGMGLAICSKVIESHRGMITAKSSPGEGSTFIVTLPVDANQGGETRG